MFQSTVSSFSPSRLRFLSGHLTDTDTLPPLDPNDTTGSWPFIIHQQYVKKLLEIIDGVFCDEDNDLVLVKKTLMVDIQEHQKYLDQIRGYEWQRCKVEKNDVTHSGGSAAPIVVQTGTFTIFRLCTH